MSEVPIEGKVVGQIGKYEYSPQQELKDRLNIWLRGDTPGLPINWRGL